MARYEINAETPREELELNVIKAARTSDSNLQDAAARSHAELWRRDRDNERDLFNSQSQERIHAQRFQEGQTAKQLDVANKQLEVADKQATSARRAMWATWASAAVAICLLILTAIQIFSSGSPPPDPAPSAAARAPA